MIKRIDAYLRLSRDDDDLKDESNSITNQRRIIMDYAASVEGLKNAAVVEHVDDGYSGTNFNRPAVTGLIEAVYKGEVHCILAKDLSRLGRTYLNVGKLIEVVFPYYGVRFIAVNDCVIIGLS